MKKTIGALLILGATLSAQHVAPPAYKTKAGETSCYMIGRYKDGHFQFAEGALRGKIALVRRVGYRLDDLLSYTTGTRAAGRTWSNVKLYFSDTNISTMTSKWTTNSLTTPQKLFDAKYSWPTIRTNPTTKPAPFDPRLSFGLTAPFFYGGKTDMLIEFLFTNGTMANGAKWGTTTTGSSPSYPYYRDAPTAVSPPEFIQGPFSYHGTRTCFDSAFTRAGGLMTLDFKSYAKGLISPRADKFFFEMSSYLTAPNKPVIQALSVFGNATGTSLGTCNKLYLGSLLAIFGGTSSGPTALKTTTFPLIPYNAKAVGLNIWAQTAWADSSTGGLKLTQAVSVKVPAQPPAPVPRVLLYYYNRIQATGLGPYNFAQYNAVVKYDLK